MKIPPREVLAAETRRVVELHDEWDSPHAFITLHWDGEKVTHGVYGCIMPGIHPKQYPSLMRKLALEEFEQNPDDPAYAYILQIEAFGCTGPGPDASEEEKRQFEADSFHKRADAREICTAWCVDIHGRAWSATNPRDSENHIEEAFYAPGKAPGGGFINGLLSVAAATGAAGHGLITPGRAHGPN